MKERIILEINGKLKELVVIIQTVTSYFQRRIYTFSARIQNIMKVFMYLIRHGETIANRDGILVSLYISVRSNLILLHTYDNYSKDTVIFH